jgi:hypothetical protein
MRGRWALILLTAMFPASLDGGRPAAAQAAGEPEEEAAAPPPRFRITDRYVDQWLFGTGIDAASARQLGEARLRSRIGYIDQVCRLSASQRKKLEVAGRGDIKRFFDRVAQMRDEIRLAAIDIERLRRLASEAQAHGRRFRDQPFDEETLFGKNLRTILDPEQAARYQRSWSEDRLKAHQMGIVWVVKMVQSRLGLSTDQSLRLQVVLLEETRPPPNSGPWSFYGIMYQASRIPEGQLRPIFDESQWRSLQKDFDEARTREAGLRASGYLPEDPPARETARSEPPQGSGGRARPDSKVLQQSGVPGDPPPAGEKHLS